MPDLFREIIPSILQTKKSVIKDEIDLKDYKPFMVNRALSYHMDCVLYANEMNMHGLVDADMQYQYLLNTIRPMKRAFAPWQKANVDKDIECIKLYFGYSDNKAKEALSILTDEQIAEIKIRTEKGGVKK
jgi:hypothetical protein